MPKLPGILLPAIYKKRPLIIALLITFSILNFKFSIGSVYAAEPPNPLPCQNPIRDESILTDNWLLDKNSDSQKAPPPGLSRITITVTRPAGTYHISEPVDFTVDFSQLGALFGKSNSDFNEGGYQNEEHRKADIKTLNQQDLNSLHGPGQKAESRVVLDMMRTKYVKYIWGNETLAESANEFADSNGQNSKTIYDLVNTPGFGIPNPPSAGEDRANWNNTWGKYWDKIPTTYSEFYEGEIVFREESKPDLIHVVETGGHCPDPLPRVIKFVMPEFFRTTATTGQLNRVLVPNAAQSDHSNDLILQANGATTQNKNLLGKVIDACLKAVKSNPITDALQKVIKIGQFLNPVKSVFAQTDPPNCIRALKDGKEGADPYCALPADQLNPNGVTGESCENKNDNLKVDRDNPNVICHFKINWEPHHNPMQIPDVGPNHNQWDECHQIDDRRWRCSVEVSIWPIFRIPWLAEIWNNTLYSDTAEHEPFIGSPLNQEKGRPGVYSFFTPVTIFETEIEALVRKCRPETDPQSQACSDLVNLASTSIEEWNQLYNSNLEDCFERFLPGPGAPPDPLEQLEKCIKNEFASLEKKKPGEVDQQTDSDLKRRFIGGTDCSKEFVWHNALYPKAAQQQYGITNACPLLAAAQSSDIGVPPGTGLPPGTDCSPVSDGNPANGIETSIEELVCYISEKAAGKTEPISGLPLTDVMLTIMGAESGGDQCAFSTAAAVGVFKYIAETWKGVANSPNIDSGSVHASSSGACWGNPGEEPVAVGEFAGNPSFDWELQFGPNLDGEAWNPYLQIDKTVIKMENGDACIWHTYQVIYGGC